MSSSGYVAWSVTAGEVPTTAYWNVLGSNDASFNTGNGFNDGIIVSRHLASGIQVANIAQNLYKFYVYRSAAYTTSNSATVIPFDTVVFDTSSNFDAVSLHRFVAPINGFYFFATAMEAGISNGGNNNFLADFYKNATTSVAQTNTWYGAITGGTATIHVSALLQLSQGDTIQVRMWDTYSTGLVTGQTVSYFYGFLVSAT